MPIKKCSFEILPAARPLSITGRARENSSFFEAVQNSQLWFQFRSIEVPIWLFSITRSFFGGGIKVSQKLNITKLFQTEKCQCLKYLNYVHAAPVTHSRLFRRPLDLWTGHTIAASYPLCLYQTWFRALDWWKKGNLSVHAHSSRSSLYKLVFLVANFQITPSTWFDV